MSGPSAVEGLLARLHSSPDVYVHRFNLVRDAALLVQFDKRVYRTSSFLDERALLPTMAAGWVGIGQMVERVRSITSGVPVNFIFHSGHVGSTLLSRLLEEAGAVLALREPLTLRNLAELHDVLHLPESLLDGSSFNALLESFLRLWARGYPDTAMTIVKATSATARLAPQLLARRPLARAVYLNLRAERYMTTLLAGASAGSDVRGHGPERIRRLQSYGFKHEAAYHKMSMGELAAMSWLAESWSRYKAIAVGGARVLPVDFDALLGQLQGTLEHILRHFGLPHDAATVARLVDSPALRQYSKAPEHTYTAEMRAEILAESRAAHGAEIAKGLAWLERAAKANAEANLVIGASGL